MSQLLYLAMGLTLVIGHDTKSSPTLDGATSEAIESFRPFWKPPADALDGVTVVIDPVGGQAGSSPERTCEDNSLLTASYLRHFIGSADGHAIVTRLGDGAHALDQVGAVSPLEFARDAERTAYISIRFDRTAENTVLRFHGESAGGSTNRLAGGLASIAPPEKMNVQWATDLRDELIKAGAGTPDLTAVTPSVCQVSFPCPERGNRREQRDRDVCRRHARALCEGLIRAFETKAESKKPVTPTDFDRAGASRARSTARRICPDGQLPIDKVKWFVNVYRGLSLPSGSLCYFNVSAEPAEGGFRIVGSTNIPNAVQGLMFALNEAGIERVHNEVRSLPDAGKLDGKIYGLCTTSVVRTYDRPGSADGLQSRALQTQLLYGEPLYLLDRDGDYYLAQARDGYWGWVPAAAVRQINEHDFREYTSHPRGVVVMDIESDALRIPRGATLPMVGNVDGRLNVLLPTGQKFPVASSAVRRDKSVDERAQARVHAALDLLQTPYLFGGKSPLGIDCSGLIANVWGRSELPSARDAWQQALAGDLVATAWDREGMAPGDQVLFIDSSGKIYHTGIAISDHHVLHASPPGVQIGSLKQGDRLFDARLNRDFFIAKRP